jgi:transposase
MNPGLILMEDDAPAHSAKETQDDLNERGIYPIFWPVFSPDLNPIETVWDRRKDYRGVYQKQLLARKFRITPSPNLLAYPIRRGVTFAA